MANRSAAFAYHIKKLIERARSAGMSEEKIRKLIEISTRWEERRAKEQDERRAKAREEQSSSRGNNG